MSGPGHGVIWQFFDFLQTFKQGFGVATRKVGSSDRIDKQSVSCKKILVYQKTLTAWSVTWRVQAFNEKFSERNLLAVVDKCQMGAIWRIVFGLMSGQINGNIVLTCQGFSASRVVEVSVSQQNPGQKQGIVLDFCQNAFFVVRRVNQHGFTAGRVSDDIGKVGHDAQFHLDYDKGAFVSHFLSFVIYYAVI